MLLSKDETYREVLQFSNDNQAMSRPSMAAGQSKRIAHSLGKAASFSESEGRAFAFSLKEQRQEEFNGGGEEEEYSIITSD